MFSGRFEVLEIGSPHSIQLSRGKNIQPVSWLYLSALKLQLAPIAVQSRPPWRKEPSPRLMKNLESIFTVAEVEGSHIL